MSLIKRLMTLVVLSLLLGVCYTNCSNYNNNSFGSDLLSSLCSTDEANGVTPTNCVTNQTSTPIFMRAGAAQNYFAVTPSIQSITTSALGQRTSISAYGNFTQVAAVNGPNGPATYLPATTCVAQVQVGGTCSTGSYVSNYISYTVTNATNSAPAPIQSGGSATTMTDSQCDNGKYSIRVCIQAQVYQADYLAGLFPVEYLVNAQLVLTDSSGHIVSDPLNAAKIPIFVY